MVQAIIDSICRELMTQYPSTPIYIEDAPTDFTRASFYIEKVLDGTEPVSKNVFRNTFTFQVVFFSPVNEYGNVDKVQQNVDYEKIKGILNINSLKVEGMDRYATITRLTADKREQDIYWNIDMYINESRPSTENVEVVNKVTVTDK